MKAKLFRAIQVLCIASVGPCMVSTPAAAGPTCAPIPWDQIGAKTGADYRGDGLSVTLTASGAKLNCIFQRLEGKATTEGLWLGSTLTNQPKDRFGVTAVAIGR